MAVKWAEEQGVDSDVIDPELPIEEGDSSGDDVVPAAGEPLRVPTGHDARKDGSRSLSTGEGPELLLLRGATE